MQLSRRALLGLAVIGVAGCGKHVAAATKPRVVVPPDSAALLAARQTEVALIAGYDKRLASAPAHDRAKLRIERAIHATHLNALNAASTVTASPAPTPTAPVVPAIAHVSRTLRASAVSLQKLAITATAGTNAALFASIAASHEVSAQ